MEIGKMLETERRKKGISRVSLAQGICSQHMIYKLETGESTVSTFMLEVLIERIEKCPDYLEYIVSNANINK